MFGRNCPNSRISCEVPSAHEAHFLARVERAFHDAHVGHDAAVRVVFAVEDEGPQGGRRASLRRRDFCDDRLEDLVDPRPLFGTHHQRFGGIEADHRLDFLEHFVDPRDGQIDLVDDGNHGKVAVDRRVGIGHRLRLDPLKRVDQQQGPFAGCQAPRHFVMEVDVPGRIDQVEFVFLPIERVIQGDGPRLDRDSAVALDLQVVEHLVAELARGDRAALQQQLVGQGALPVVDVSHDREVADVSRIHIRQSEVAGLPACYRRRHCII